MSPQEIRYAKISIFIGIFGLIIAFLAWIHPFAPSSEPSGTSEATASSARTGQSLEPDPSKPPVNLQHSDENHSSSSGAPPKEEGTTGLNRNGEESTKPHTDRHGSAKPTRSCDSPEIASLRPGVPVKVASALAVLSVKTAQEGSEPFLTLGIASDRDTLAKPVYGAPVRYRFATSRGAYFVNVTSADLTDGSMTVQVGCETKENMP
jgi:hypothetical protein